LLPGFCVSAPHEVCRTHRCKVLLVDDESLIRRLTARALIEADYDVIEAADGDEALALLRSGTPVDVVISDVMMPRMSGLELAERVKEEFPQLRMILISGYESGRHAPFPLVPKPFQLSDLVAQITRALEGGDLA
jgi:CheY-like chemotaxis protein